MDFREIRTEDDSLASDFDENPACGEAAALGSRFRGPRRKKPIYFIVIYLLRAPKGGANETHEPKSRLSPE